MYVEFLYVKPAVCRIIFQQISKSASFNRRYNSVGIENRLRDRRPMSWNSIPYEDKGLFFCP
jgi:hypothetical protein